MNTMSYYFLPYLSCVVDYFHLGVHSDEKRKDALVPPNTMTWRNNPQLKNNG